MEKVTERGVYKLCYCGTKFYEYPYLKGKRNYCSTNCSNKANALKQSETKKRLKIGKGRQAWNKGKNKEQQLIYINLINKKEENKKQRIPWNKGKHLSKEHKKSIGKSRKGLAFSDKCLLNMSLARIGKSSGMLGKHHSEIAKIKMSDTKKKLGIEPPHYFGKENSSWQGGISFGEYGLEFNKKLKKKIRERDNYICQKCYKYGNVVHHIDYNKKNNDKENLITVCFQCNSAVNYNRDKWEEYFSNLIKKKYDK